MSKYKVIKPMPAFTVGSTYETFDQEMTEFLLQKGFIEPIKEDARWRPKVNERYYWVDDCQNVESTGLDDFSELTDDGNIFKSEATARKVADSLKLYFEWLHYPHKPVDNRKPQLLLDFQMAQREARKAVLRDDKGE